MSLRLLNQTVAPKIKTEAAAVESSWASMHVCQRHSSLLKQRLLHEISSAAAVILAGAVTSDADEVWTDWG